MAIDTLGANALASDSVTTAKIATDAITTAKIANDAVTGAKIPAGAVVADIADGGITTAKLADDAVTTAKIASEALDGSHVGTDAFMIDTWYMTANQVSSSSSFLIGSSDSSTWTNQTNNTNRGSSRMSVSGATFTFPLTGIYRIDFFGTFYADDNDTNIRLDILATTNNASYADVVRQSAFHTASTQFAACHASYVFDVTSTTTHKVKFSMDSATNATIRGGQGPMFTYVIFERLGNT